MMHILVTFDLAIVAAGNYSCHLRRPARFALGGGQSTLVL